jgi:hypothetical protein
MVSSPHYSSMMTGMSGSASDITICSSDNTTAWLQKWYCTCCCTAAFADDDPSDEVIAKQQQSAVLLASI